LDEPTNGLDPVGVLDLRGMLLSRSRDEGVAVLVSSHHLDEVARIADRITVMHRGLVIGDLGPGGVDLERRFFDMVYAAEKGGPWTQQSPPRP
jgi:ABC-2 type transport system ATP-binding protein